MSSSISELIQRGKTFSAGNYPKLTLKSSIVKNKNKDHKKLVSAQTRHAFILSEMTYVDSNINEALIRACGTILPHSIHALIDAKIAPGTNALNPSLARAYAKQSLSPNSVHSISPNDYILTVVDNLPFSFRNANDRQKNYDYVYHLIQVLQASTTDTVLTWNQVKHIIADKFASAKFPLFASDDEAEAASLLRSLK